MGLEAGRAVEVLVAAVARVADPEEVAGPEQVLVAAVLVAGAERVTDLEEAGVAPVAAEWVEQAEEGEANPGNG